MTTIGVASLCLSLPHQDHPEGIQKSTKWEINDHVIKINELILILANFIFLTHYNVKSPWLKNDYI